MKSDRSPSAKPTLLDRLAGLLSRRATGAGVPEMDGLRFPALTIVFLHHLVGRYVVEYQPFAAERTLPNDWWLIAKESLFLRFVSHAGFTMPMFFVISGFVLGLPFLRAIVDGQRRPRVATFYVRRLLRLEPPYLIALLVAFWNIVWVQGKPLMVFLPHLIASMFYMHNVIYDTPSWVLGVAWSLEVEAQFYFLMPLLAALLFTPDQRSRRIRLGLLVLASSLLSHIVLQDIAGARWNMSVLNYMQYFGAGFLLADLYVADWSKKPSVNRGRWDGIGLASLVAMLAIVLYAPGSDVWFLDLPDRWEGGSFGILLPWLAILFYSAVMRGRYWNWIMTRRWMVIGGGMCYTVYLYHTLGFNLILYPAHQLVGGRFGVEVEAFLLFVLCLIPTLIGSAVLFVLIEKPFMGRRLRFWRGGGGSSPGAAVAPR